MSPALFLVDGGELQKSLVFWQTVADDNSANRRRDTEILAPALEEVAKALNGIGGALKRKK